MATLTKVEHTPGPWRVYTAPQGHKLIGIGEANGAGIVDCGFGVWRGGSEEALANAHLIAAAPDLLEALKMARECIAYCRRAHKDAQSGEGVPIEIFIDAAIARAGGA